MTLGRLAVLNKQRRNMILRTFLSWLPGRSFLIRLSFCAVVPALVAVSCTQYKPLGQGAKVPWAKALVSGKGGPIGQNRYRVGEGDALGLIAERYGVRLAALANANNIQSPYILYPGEVLRIPANRNQPLQLATPAPPVQPTLPPVQPAAPSIQQTALPAPPAEQSIETTPPPRWEPRARSETRPATRLPARVEPGGKRYVVGAGDSLSVIADQHGLRLGELVAANGLEAPYRIKPGQPLIIPPTEADRRRQTAARQQQSIGSKPAGSLVPPPPLSADGFLWPVQGEVVSTFEQNAAKGRSGGINISARRGTPVRAADNGIVAYAGEALSGYGQMILLRHAEGYVTLYAHNDILRVREGEVVRRGQTIAEVGSSGDVAGSQLHFEIRKGTSPIDPTKVLAGLPGRRLSQLTSF